MFKFDKRSVTSSSNGGGVIVSRDSPFGGFGGDGPRLLIHTPHTNTHTHTHTHTQHTFSLTVTVSR